MNANEDHNAQKKMSWHRCSQCYDLIALSELASRKNLECISSEIQIGLSPGLFHYCALLINAREKMYREKVSYEKITSATGNTASTESIHHQCMCLIDCFKLIFLVLQVFIKCLCLWMDIKWR